MNTFVSKASSKISKLSDEQILGIINTQAAELKLRSLVLDNAFIGYVLVDKEGNIAYINKQTSSLVPVYKKRKYTSCPIEKVFMEQKVALFLRSCIDEDKNNVSQIFEFEDSSGERKFINCRTSKVEEYDGLLFTFSDVTFFNKFKDEFRKNESLASMTTMAAGVAHEIKNPLASVSIYVQLLQKELDKKGSISADTASKYIPIIKEGLDRINSIAVDFLFAVKPMKVNFEKCSFNEIVEKVSRIARAEMEANNIALVLNLYPSMPNVLMDVGLMQQALLNLVKNGIQAMEDTGREKKITISTYLEGSSSILSVSDTGCGMTEKQMEKIFEPYFTTKSNGTGLGLTVLFKIIKEHGGDIKVHSVKDEGSEFLISLPIPQEELFRIQYNPEGK